MIWLLWLPVTLAAPRIFPLVDPGLFVISGVNTCGGGSGYCLLGLDCTLDEDFLPDDEEGQHCEGLKSAFTPSAHFVCCRAANKSVHKPPIVLPSSGTTGFTEPVTTRTTTLDLLENEIDQVLLKVAESVNSLKKSPSTEATEAQTDLVDQPAELRETVEISSQGETYEEDPGGEMLADSPETYDSNESSDSKNHPTMMNPSPLHEPPSEQHNKPLSEFPGMNSDIFTEKMSDENTLAPEDSLAEFSTKMTYTEKHKLETLNNNEMLKLPQENKNTSSMEVQDNTQESDKGENSNTSSEYFTPKIKDDGIMLNQSTNSLFLEKISLNSTSSNENYIDTNIIKERPLQQVITLNTTITEVSTDIHSSKDKNSEISVTKQPDLLTDQATDQNESNVDAEWNHIKQNETTEQPTSENVSNNEDNQSIILPNTRLNEVVMSTDNMKTQINSLNNIVKEDKELVYNETEKNTKNSTETNPKTPVVPAEIQLATSTTISPATKTPNNGEAMASEEADQGQLVVDDPCSRNASRNCTEEIRFVFQGQTLCFGSIYAVDWIVTSASCALRIFRAGMLNVSIIPLTGSQRGDVKTIIVHEGYGEGAGSTGQEMEANNIGLVQLRVPVAAWSSCVPCLPNPQQDFTSVDCSALTSDPQGQYLTINCSVPGSNCKERRAESSTNSCKAPARLIRDDHGFPYITIPCDTLWAPRHTDATTRAIGTPLFCDSMLAGIEASTGVGLKVYTPVSRYLDWLLKNTRPGLPEQHFNVG